MLDQELQTQQPRYRENNLLHQPQIIQILEGAGWSVIQQLHDKLITIPVICWALVRNDRGGYKITGMTVAGRAVANPETDAAFRGYLPPGWNVEHYLNATREEKIALGIDIYE